MLFVSVVVLCIYLVAFRINNYKQQFQIVHRHLLIDCLRLDIFSLKLLFLGPCIHTYYDSAAVFPVRAALPVALADPFSDNSNSSVEPRGSSSSLKVHAFPECLSFLFLGSLLASHFPRGELHFNFAQSEEISKTILLR